VRGTRDDVHQARADAFDAQRFTSEEYRTELAKFKDEVAPLPANAIADVIEEDLGAPPDKLFAFFDVKPLGSASIGQVHAARLYDGREVVLKVRKPGVDELVRIDLEILEGLVEEWTPRFPILQQYDARGLARDFSDALLAELDYSREAANVKFFRDVFAREHGFKIPAVIAEYSIETGRITDKSYSVAGKFH
jgi:ubiquinone biosynthesis protein